MNYLLFLVIGITAHLSHGYVVKLQNDTRLLANRKLFNGFKRFSVRERADDVSNDLPNADPNIEKLMFSIDTGAEATEKKNSPAVNTLEKAVKELGKIVASPGNPVFRAAEGYNIKPEIVHFRANKPSVKFQINSQSIIDAVKDLLSSHTVRRYADDLAQKAAIVFNVIKEELAKD